MTVDILEAVVLVGGEDQRLAPLTSAENPKCLLSVGNTTLLLYSLRALKEAGIMKFILVRSLLSCHLGLSSGMQGAASACQH
jgi:NDP-sugar pyrophosphorylase family protein